MSVVKEWLQRVLRIMLGNDQGVPVREPTPHGLVAVLLDKAVDDGSRDDAAMDLSAFDLPEVEAALIRVAEDHADEENVIESAADSLCEIWSRHGRTPSPEVVARMHPVAQRAIHHFYAPRRNWRDRAV